MPDIKGGGSTPFELTEIPFEMDAFESRPLLGPGTQSPLAIQQSDTLVLNSVIGKTQFATGRIRRAILLQMRTL